MGEEQCSIREPPSSPLGLASLVAVLLLPLLLGPLPLLLAHLLLRPCSRHPGVGGGHLACLALLTLACAATYSTNMLLAELYFAELGGVFEFVLVKSCLGSLHAILSPLAVFLSYPEVQDPDTPHHHTPPTPPHPTLLHHSLWWHAYLTTPYHTPPPRCAPRRGGCSLGAARCR